MHYVKAKNILSKNNGMNLYRGCLHGCIYCDARSKCYHMEHLFEDVEVKENAIALLEQELKRRRKPCMIGMGSMSDPYIPLEYDLGYTKKALQLIYKYGFGISLLTKSDRVLRDLDLLRTINDHTKAVVQMTLTTLDESLCRILEPNVCSTHRRFETLSRLHDAGIPTVVWLCPILPFINDTEENIRGILRYCVEANVKGIVCFGMGVTLREGNREYFYKMLDRHFPGMKEKYIRTYGQVYAANSPNWRKLMDIFENTCIENGIMHQVNDVFDYLKRFERKDAQFSFL